MGVVLRCLRFGLVKSNSRLWAVIGVFLPDEVTVTVMIEEDDGTVEKPVGIGTGTGMLTVEETVTVLTPEADDDSEAAALTVEVTVVSLEADEDTEAAALTVEVTVVTLEADDDPEAGALEAVDDSVVVELETVLVTVNVTASAVDADTVDVTVLVADPDIALYALESTLVTEAVTVEMAVGMGIGTGTMTGTDAPEVLMLEEVDEPEGVTDDAAVSSVRMHCETKHVMTYLWQKQLRTRYSPMLPHLTEHSTLTERY